LIDRALRLGRAVIYMARRGAAAVRCGVARPRNWWPTRVDVARVSAMSCCFSSGIAALVCHSHPLPWALAWFPALFIGVHAAQRAR